MKSTRHSKLVLAVLLAMPAPAALAEWQSCSSALSAVRLDASNAQREADAAVRGERELELVKRDAESCRTAGRDPHNDNCRTARQQYETKNAALESQVRTLQFQLTILDRSVSGAGLACGKSLRFLPVAPPPAK